MNWSTLVLCFLVIGCFVVVESAETYTVASVGTPVGGGLTGRVVAHSRKEAERQNSNGGSSSHSEFIYTGPGFGPGEGGTESWVMSEGTKTTWQYATVIYDSAGSCQWSITWRTMGHNPITGAPEIFLWVGCATIACYDAIWECVAAAGNYSSSCFSLFEGCTTKRKRDAETGEWVEDENAMRIDAINEMASKRYALRQEKRSDGSADSDDSDVDNGCLPVGANCSVAFPFSESDIQYDIGPDDVVIPSRLFNISTFGLLPFATDEPKIATIQATFSLIRNEICDCEFGFAINHVVDEASVMRVSISIPYDVKPVSMVYSKLLPQGEQDIAVAFICTPDPSLAEVYFSGTPSISVDLQSLYL